MVIAPLTGLCRSLFLSRLGEAVAADRLAVPGPGKSSRPVRSAVFILVFASVFSLALFRVCNYDIWFLLKTGELICQTGSVPRSDPFSYTSFGRPWLMHEWLFCVLAEGVRRYLGIDALVVAKAAVAALSFLLVVLAAGLRASWRAWPVWVVGAFAVLGGCVSRFRFLARPHLFNLLGVAAVLLILEAFRSGRRWALLFLLPVVVVWANIQAGAVIGPALLLASAAGSTADTLLRRFGTSGRSKEGILLFGAGAACSAALLVNPYGTGIFRFVVEAFLRHGVGGEVSVAEWRPPGASFGLFWVLAAGVWLSLLWGIRRVRGSDLVVVALASVLAILARRYIPIFLLVATPAVGGLLKGWSSKLGTSRSPKAMLLGSLAWGLAAICVGTTLAAEGPLAFGLGINSGAYPVGGVDFVVREGIFGRMYNSHRFGGYIIFRTYPGRKVFIDGRNVVHRHLWEEFATRSFFKIADDYGVDYAIVDTAYDSRRYFFSSWAQEELRSRRSVLGWEKEWLDWARKHGGWHLVYWDDVCAVYVDGSDKFRSIRERYEYRYIDPLAPEPSYLARYLANERTRQGVIAEGERAVSEAPDSLSAHLLLGSILLYVGQYDRSIREFQEALRIAPRSTRARLGLAQARRRLERRPS